MKVGLFINTQFPQGFNLGLVQKLPNRLLRE